MVQNIIVILIVAAAIIYMVRKIYKSLKGEGGCQCGGCSKCSLLKDMAKNKAEAAKKEAKDDCCCKKH